MDVSSLDYSHGARLEAQVRSRFGSSVASPSPDEASSFWLVAAFSRSRLKLHEHSIGSILQSVLGGTAISFVVVEIEDGFFKFTVISKAVGLFVYKLRSFKCSAFRVFFHLWNENGISFARKSLHADRGPVHEWTEVKKKKPHPKPVHIPVQSVFKRIFSDLHGSKPRISVFSRLNLSQVPDSVFTQPSRTSSKIWMPKGAESSNPSPDHAEDLSLNLGVKSHAGKASFAEVVKGKPPLTGANQVPIGF